MDISASISTALGALKIVREGFSLLLSAKIEETSKVEISKAMTELGNVQDTLFALREELSKLQSDRDNLRKELEQRDNWDKKISEYELKKAPGGGMVYSFKGKPNHYICPRCISKKELQILQDTNNIHTGYFICPNCNKYYTINFPQTPPERNRFSVL